MAHLLDVEGRPQATYIIANQVPPRAQLVVMLLGVRGYDVKREDEALSEAFRLADRILEMDAATVGQSKTLAKVV